MGFLGKTLVRKLILGLALTVCVSFILGCGAEGDSAGKPMSEEEAEAIRGESLRDSPGRPAEPNVKKEIRGGSAAAGPSLSLTPKAAPAFDGHQRGDSR